MLLLSLLALNAYRQKQKANKMIISHIEEVEKHKHIIEEKQKEILDSIHYAKRIQTALLPSERYMVRNLKKFK